MTQGVKATRDEALKNIIGKKVEQASSELTVFAIKFNDGTGVIFDAVEPSSPTVAARIVEASELPNLAEAVCSVDWSWICGCAIEEATPGSSFVRLKFSTAGPLTIGTGLWEGKPFLSFQPFRPSKK
ncbi:MAG: hypothetical protein SGJ27_24150 [Candidatus Melainabacteria bacterium]|nr:hypothetical protein [Candidatus Melainabacteria bacterium]